MVDKCAALQASAMSGTARERTEGSIPIYIKKEVVPKGTTSLLERVMGIEPTQPAWKAGILAVELHPHLNDNYNTI